MPIPRGNKYDRNRAQAIQVEHTQGELSVDRDRRETLYKNIGSLELVVLQNASRFTGPKHATVATQIRDTPASSAMSCGEHELPAACELMCLVARGRLSSISPVRQHTTRNSLVSCGIP